MNKVTRYFTIILLFAGSGILYAQQLPTYTQYLNNGFLINPALAGNDGYTSFNTTYRKQWIGFENSPTTYSISGQTRLLRHSYKIVKNNVRKNTLKPSTKGRVGLGGFVFNDRNGQINRTGASFAYAYHIYLRQSQISFGVSGQAFQYKIKISDLDFGNEIQTDPVKNGGDLVTFVPDANAGFFWTGEKHFLGVSANQLFQSVIRIGGTETGQLIARHYYIMGGYTFTLNQEFEIEPSLLFTTTDQFIPQVDLSTRLIFQNEYWAGLSYRSSGSVSALIGAKVEKLYFGLAYDYALTSIRKRSLGSVEIVLALKFGSNARRYRWINRF